MSYKRTLRGVNYLIVNELDTAREYYGDTFASMHEGAAVLKEEIEEARVESVFVEEAYNALWYAVKEDDEKRARHNAEEIASRAERLACEAIQVAAMALKFVDTVEGMEANDDR